MAILDQYGNPIQSKALDEPQTARLAWLRRQWDEHPGRRLTPARLKAILDDAERGDIVAQHELFMDMEELDAHITAELGKRVLALTVLDWDITPPRNPTPEEEAAAALAKEWLQDFAGLPGLIAGLASGIGHAFACGEIAWARDGKEWLPASIDVQPHTWFTVGGDRKTLLLRSLSATVLQDGLPTMGEPLQPFGWIVHRHQAKSGLLARAGLHRALAWPFLFKNYAIGDLAELLEIYGIPMRIGKYQPGAGDTEKATLLKAIMSIGHNAGGIIPQGMEIEFEAAAAGNADPFLAMIDWCEKSQSKVILGGTLTSQADGKTSTNALGNVHQEVRRDLTRSDAQQLAATLTSDLVFPLLALNSKTPITLRRCPRFVFDTGEAEDIEAYAAALPKLSTVMQIPAAWAHDKLRIPQPKEGEAVLKATAAPPLPVDKAQASAEPMTAAASAALPVGAHTCPQCTAALSAGIADTPDDLDGLRDLALEGWKPVMQPMTHPLMAALGAAVQQGKTLEQFQAELPALLEKMDIRALTESLAMASFVARAAGESGMDIASGGTEWPS